MKKKTTMYERLSVEMTENIQALVRMNAYFELYDEAEYPTRTAIIKALRSMRACENGIAFVQGCESWQEAWDKCNMGSWMEWYMKKLIRVEAKTAGDLADFLEELNSTIDQVEKDAPCGCGCGLNLYYSEVADSKIARLLREKYPVAPTSPADLALHDKFYLFS